MSSRWEVASRIAHRELVPWMSADYSSNQINVYMLRSQAGRIRLGNIVDPKCTVGASILKKYLVS
jgi:amidase